jgi:hypothetical protein
MMASAENTERIECKRPGCKGILRNAESIARGTSKACEKKVREAEALAAKGGDFTADQRAKAAAAVRSGKVTVIAPGLYAVPSAKGDGTEYACDGRSCTCPAGARTRTVRCWHLLVARVLDILLAAAPAVPVPAADWAELDRLTAAFMTAA